MKTCTSCFILQDDLNFYIDKRLKDRRRSKCKNCMSLIRKKYRLTLAFKLSHQKAKRKYNKKPEVRAKNYARKALHLALKNKVLYKEPCQVCNNPVVEGHHHDYSKPLKVTWLCKIHHREVHNKEV